MIQYLWVLLELSLRKVGSLPALLQVGHLAIVLYRLSTLRFAVSPFILPSRDLDRGVGLRGYIPGHPPPRRRLIWLISVHDSSKFLLEVGPVLPSQSLLLGVWEVLSMGCQMIWLEQLVLQG